MVVGTIIVWNSFHETHAFPIQDTLHTETRLSFVAQICTFVKVSDSSISELTVFFFFKSYKDSVEFISTREHLSMEDGCGRIHQVVESQKVIATEMTDLAGEEETVSTKDKVFKLCLKP